MSNTASAAATGLPKFTRRSLVAAAPAAFVTAAVPAFAAAGADPDAELLQLAKDFERLHREWQDLDAVADRLEPAISAHFDAKKHTMAELWECRKEYGYDDAVAIATDKLDELDVVANRMRELPAQTLQGLAVKARLAQFDVHLSGAAGMARPEIDWDWDVKCMEHFVREIERFASVYARGGLDA